MAYVMQCPDDVLGWIPSYPDAGLDDAQRGAVEVHAAGCQRCRDEIALVRGEVDPVVDPSETEAVLARVLERARNAERPQASATPSLSAPRRRAQRLLLTRIALAAGLAFAFAAAGALGALAVRGGEGPLYTTAAEPTAASSDDRPLLDVVFRDDAEARRIHAALRAVNGQIVAGPSELGRYQVRLGAGADARAAARALAAEDAGVAVFAEPAPQ